MQTQFSSELKIDISFDSPAEAIEKLGSLFEPIRINAINHALAVQPNFNPAEARVIIEIYPDGNCKASVRHDPVTNSTGS